MKILKLPPWRTSRTRPRNFKKLLQKSQKMTRKDKNCHHHELCFLFQQQLMKWSEREAGRNWKLWQNLHTKISYGFFEFKNEPKSERENSQGEEDTVFDPATPTSLNDAAENLFCPSCDETF
jgi:hypothetical protein